MILAVDVHYGEEKSLVSAISFSRWNAKKPEGTYFYSEETVGEYIPGEFYKRELPCIVDLLKEHRLKPQYIVIDGYVYLDGISQPGLGKHLYDALEGKSKIIGVAKQPYIISLPFCEVYRGESRKPLYVTSEGVSQDKAMRYIEEMHGAHRMPTLLKLVDSLSRRS